MKKVQRFIFAKLCKLYIAGHQELKILQMPIPKITKFLRRLHIDIKKPLSIIF